jgi:hypothetical protein
MGVFDGILTAKTGLGYLESIVFRNDKIIAVMPETEEEVKADVIFSYNYKSSVKITDNPVENGIIVNDHRIIQPEYVTLDVGVSNIVGLSDIISNQDIGTAIQAAKIYIFGNRFDAQSRIAASYQDLKIAQYNSDTFQLLTPMGVFDDMVIQDIDSTQDPDTISAFRGRVVYKKIIKYNVETRKLTDVSGLNAITKIGRTSTKRISPSLVPSGVSF